MATYLFHYIGLLVTQVSLSCAQNQWVCSSSEPSTVFSKHVLASDKLNLRDWNDG